jgi:hypothetical protein
MLYINVILKTIFEQCCICIINIVVPGPKNSEAWNGTTLNTPGLHLSLYIFPNYTVCCKCYKDNFWFQATKPILKWEQKFINMMEDVSKHTQGMKVFYEAGRRFDDMLT